MPPLEFGKPKENRPKASLIDFEKILTAERAVEKIPINEIEVFSYKGQAQPFSIDEHELEAMTFSIRQKGQLTPIIVRRIDEGFQVLSGHKRLAACKKLGFETLDAVIIDVANDETAFDIACQANVQRRTLKPSELSKMYNVYLSQNRSEFAREVTADNICELFNVSRKTIYRYANMEKLTDDITSLIDNKKIAVSAIELLAKLSDEQQQAVADYIKNCGNLSGKELRAVVSYLIDYDSCSVAAALKNIEESSNDEPKEINLTYKIREEFFDEFKNYSNDELCEAVIALLRDKDIHKILEERKDKTDE